MADETTAIPPEPTNTGVTPKQTAAKGSELELLRPAENATLILTESIAQMTPSQMRGQAALITGIGAAVKLVETELHETRRQTDEANRKAEDATKSYYEEKVTTAVLSTKLGSARNQRRISAFLIAAGSILIGHGLGRLETADGRIFCGTGVLLLLAGVWFNETEPKAR